MGARQGGKREGSSMLPPPAPPAALYPHPSLRLRLSLPSHPPILTSSRFHPDHSSHQPIHGYGSVSSITTNQPIHPLAPCASRLPYMSLFTTFARRPNARPLSRALDARARAALRRGWAAYIPIFKLSVLLPLSLLFIFHLVQTPPKFPAPPRHDHGLLRSPSPSPPRPT